MQTTIEDLFRATQFNGASIHDAISWLQIITIILALNLIVSIIGLFKKR